MNKLKKLLGAVSAFAFVMGLIALVPSTSNAALNDKVCGGIQTVLQGDNQSGADEGDCSDGESGEDTLSKTINSVINLFSLVVGATSVIMIIYGGFKYITSGGNDENTKSAKNTILYALVGLIIVLLAQTIVKFVFSKATQLNAESDS